MSARLVAGLVLVVATLGAATACGGDRDRDDEVVAPVASESSSAATPTTTAASPVTSGARDEAITLTAPTQDSTVGRSFVVRGSGVAFEGTLLWKLADAGGGEAVSGFASAGSTEKQPFQFTVEAPRSGSYTLTVYRESAADGSPTDVVSRRLLVS